ncbi:Rho GTPase-activating protein 21 [Taenia crassiceps]|uniref:Rho GTPase-activating protein 21 n=1 Tax=Taenia crassiceps TaxID=6207 RepID=A0ABR4QIY3_9CEST
MTQSRLSDSFQRLKKRCAFRRRSYDANENAYVIRAKTLSSNKKGEFGPVYGTELSSQPHSSEHPGVPRLLVLLVGALEATGLDAFGLYRVPGRNSSIKEAIEFIKEQSDDIKNLFTLRDLDNSAVLTSLIKRYLMALPQKLLDCGSWDSIVESISSEDVVNPMKLPEILCQIRAKIEKTFDSTPEGAHLRGEDQLSEAQCRLATLCFVMDHLQRVLQAQEAKSMTYESFAICLTPCLFGIEAHCSKVLEVILEHWKWIGRSLHQETEGKSSSSEILWDARRYVLGNLRAKFFNKP